MSVSRETLADLATRWALPPEAADRLERILEGLAKEPHPATAVAEPDQAAEVHVADSLAGLQLDELRSAARIADVGAGAGFPGLVLAAALPHAQVDLVEANARKAESIGRLAAVAGLHNARPVALRAEDWARRDGGGAYCAVTARAVADLAVLLEYAAPLLVPGGALVAWKGPAAAAEEPRALRAAEALGMAFTRVLASAPEDQDDRRSLYVYSKVRETPSRYPRRPGMATKRPLGR